jgi:hypothetical protein
MGGRRERLSLVLTSAEKSLVEQLAEVEGGLSLAATIRRLIRQAARQHGLEPYSRSQRVSEGTIVTRRETSDVGRDGINGQSS